MKPLLLFAARTHDKNAKTFGKMTFTPDFKPPSKQPANALWFIYDSGRLLVKIQDESCSIPATPDLKSYLSALFHKQYLGTLDGRPCFAAEIAGDDQMGMGLEARDLRALFGKLDENLIWIAGRANQLVNWNQTHLHCGSCGQPTENKTEERAKICPQCGLTNYPRLSPAVIVAVLKNDKILLGRNKRFKLPFYSVLAGFVEPGETLEQCVEREIREEVGIAVENIRYFGSQPWPFPDSLMIAFTADYTAGEISIDGSEIIEAAWFAKDNLPKIPPKISIARQLIEWFIQNH
ncbi:MAG: NAD(+) diphosphatase [Desulfobacterales bacterium]